ncbi:TPA: hypothetical protein ACXN3T_003429 [Proteus mirabilis]
MLTKEQKNYLKKDGHVFIPSLLPDVNSIDFANLIGSLFYPAKLNNNKLFNFVDILSPKDKNINKENTYSGIFGMSEFPYHTDFANLSLPPRYLLLRCFVGTLSVKTNILSLDKILVDFDYNKLKKCILKPRNKLLTKYSLPLFLIFNNQYIRWDSVFLEPANKHAENFYDWMQQQKWRDIESSFSLLNKGDTLIIDNWKTLHSRSLVTEESKSRTIERVYLSEIWV